MVFDEPGGEISVGNVGLRPAVARFQHLRFGEAAESGRCVFEPIAGVANRISGIS